MPVVSRPSKSADSSSVLENELPFPFPKFVPSPDPSSKRIGKRLIPRPEPLKADCKIGLASLPTERMKLCRRKGAKLTMILAGCSGTGKTTFLNTLFGDILDDPSSEKDSMPYEIREKKYRLVEDNFELDLTTVDVPGFGAKMDNQYSWLPIVRYIDHYFRRYMLQEEQPERKQLVDNRVHVCLYFIQPSNTSLSALDIESMKEISKRVNLIPVVARSDTLNKDELTDFKKTINQALKAYDIGVCKFISDEEVLSKIHNVAPYAVVGSNAMFKNSEGNMVKARKYHWGMVEIENPEHCDFLLLREVLLSEHMLDLIQSTEAHYNAYRTWCLRERVERALEEEMSGGKSQLSLEDDEDGLSSYALYNKIQPWTGFISQEDMDADDARLELEARKLLTESMKRRELKIREFKKVLMRRQAEYNEELKKEHERVTELSEQIRRMTAGSLKSSSHAPEESIDQSDPRAMHLLKNEFLGE